MNGVFLAGALAFMAWIAGPVSVLGADVQGPRIISKAPPVGPVTTQIISYCRNVWICGRRGCGWQHTCPRRCPSPYSCSSLYGAYAPYGGTPYWGRYTGTGWGYYR